MNITRLNRRECSLNMAGKTYVYFLTGTRTCCSRKYIPGIGCVYDVTQQLAQKRISKISNPSTKMDGLGLN